MYKSMIYVFEISFDHLKHKTNVLKNTELFVTNYKGK